VRNGIATLVTDTKEVLELLQEIAPEPASETMLLPDTRKGLTRDQNLVLDALPVRRYLPPGNLTDKAGLPLPVVLGAMGILAARGLAETNGLGWRRSDLPER
jgi:DNA processing protein